MVDSGASSPLANQDQKPPSQVVVSCPSEVAPFYPSKQPSWKESRPQSVDLMERS